MPARKSVATFPPDPGAKGLTESEPSPVRVVYVDPVTGQEIDPAVRAAALQQGNIEGRDKAAVDQSQATLKSIHRFTLGVVGSLPMLFGALLWLGYKSQSPGTRMDDIVAAGVTRDSLSARREIARDSVATQRDAQFGKSLVDLTAAVRDLAYQGCVASAEGQRAGGVQLCTNRFFRTPETQQLPR